jgi:molybdenum cofactor biosynthesis enzyme MoaA
MVCRMVFDELCVLANGDIVCSCGDPAGLRVYGNVKRDRIADVYEGRKYREIRRWQLASRPNSWCPVVDTACAGRTSRATDLDGERGRRVRMLQLEPISYCNLRCPGCPATVMLHAPGYARDRQNILPLDTMLDVLQQLPDLEKLLFYNFGEPFLHPEAVPFLREVRRSRPDVVIHTSTNGVLFRDGALEAVAREALSDRVVFSIDGAFPESYARYRVRGELEKALANMRAMVEERGRAGTSFEIKWQYILFRWNDSDEEIAEAKRRAAEIGVPLMWVVTHTEGASERYRFGTPELAELMGERHAFDAMTCDLRLADLWRDGAPSARQGARFETAVRTLSGPGGARRLLEVRVRNSGAEAWNRVPRSHRIGVRFTAPSGRIVADEVQRRPLPPLAPGEEIALLLDVGLPSEPGEYALFVDVVEEWVCWFHERGSTPLVIPISVTEGAEAAWNPRALVEATFASFGAGHLREAADWWCGRLERGIAIEVFLAELGEAVGRTDWREKPRLLETLRPALPGLPVSN